jgi:hypothetical protein
MKNRDILNLVNGGILAATAHSLPVEHFYKWHKFRRAMEKQYMIIDKEQKDMMSECGIDPSKIREAPEEAMDRFEKLNKKLLDEDAHISLPSPIPVDLYKGLYDENKSVNFCGMTIDVFANIKVETAVLEYLFTDGEEAEEK